MGGSGTVGRGRLRGTSAALAVPLFGLVVFMLVTFLPAARAFGDSVSVTTRDIGGGQIEATITSSVSCSSFCAWFAHAVERHSSLSCQDDTTFIRWVGAFHEQPGTATESVTFRPFFPRYTKLCVFLHSSVGITAAETTITLPAGYGAQRSSAYNCSDFGSRAAAQYYLYLYPSDPSGLDADNDGAACEANSCPCGAELIPSEPEPPPSPAVALPPARSRAYLPFISTSTFRCNRLSVSAGREGWDLSAIPSSGDKPFLNRIELKLTGPVTRPVKHVVPGSKRTVQWGWLPAGRYRLTISYPGDDSYLPSHTKVLRPKVYRCHRRR